MDRKGPKNAPEPTDVPFGAPVPKAPLGLPDPPNFPDLSGFQDNQRERIPRLEVRGKKIFASSTPYPMKDLLKAIAGAWWDKKFRAWTYPASPVCAAALFSLFPQAVTNEEFRALVEAKRMEDKAQMAKTATDAELSKFDTLTTPWLHQKQAFHFAFGRISNGGGVMLAMDMGTGKSKVTIDLLNNIDFGHGGTTYSCLIVCPKAVILHWPREFVKHSVHAARCVPLAAGPVGRRVELAEEALWQWEESSKVTNGNADPLIIITNYEAVIRPEMKKFILSREWDAMIVDESHRIKAPGGKQSMTLSRARDNAFVRVGLTGTPMPKGPEDLYAQFRFIDPGLYGLSNARFRARYVVMGGFEGRQIIGYRNRDELESKFDSAAFRADADDVLDLPESKDVELICQLSPAEMSAYRKMEKDLVAMIDGGLITASNALSKLVRLQQIVQGWVKDVNGELRQVGHTKEDVLFDLLQDMADDEPVAVMGTFYSDLDSVHRVAKRLGRGSLECSGRKAGDGLEEWQQGGAPILAVQIRSGAEGVDLTRARYQPYMGGTFDYGKYMQSRRRTLRPGQKRDVTYYHIIAENTVDKKIYAAYNRKGKLIESVLDALRH